MTDQKSQGKQFPEVLLNLKGVRGGGNTETKPSFMSLYVQLSRAERWEGLHLFRKPARSDFIEPKNMLDREMKGAVLKLERLGEETRRRFEQDYRHEQWFRDWNDIPEAVSASEAADEEDASLMGGKRSRRIHAKPNTVCGPSPRFVLHNWSVRFCGHMVGLGKGTFRNFPLRFRSYSRHLPLVVPPGTSLRFKVPPGTDLW